MNKNYQEGFNSGLSFLKGAQVILDLNVPHYYTNESSDPQYNLNKNMPQRRIIGFRNPDMLMIMKTQLGEWPTHPHIEIATPEEYVQEHNELMRNLIHESERLPSFLRRTSQRVQNVIKDREEEILKSILLVYELDYCRG